MRDVLQYFDLMLKLIEFSQAVSSRLDLEQLDYKRGTVEGAIYFADGSRLEFTEKNRHRPRATYQEAIPLSVRSW